MNESDDNSRCRDLIRGQPSGARLSGASHFLTMMMMMNKRTRTRERKRQRQRQRKDKDKEKTKTCCLRHPMLYDDDDDDEEDDDQLNFVWHIRSALGQKS